MNKRYGYYPGHDAFEANMHDERDVSPATNLMLQIVMRDPRIDEDVKDEARGLRDKLQAGNLSDAQIIDALVQAVLDLNFVTPWRGGPK